MAKYRKKPIVIEAVRFDENGKFDGDVPAWMDTAAMAGTVYRAGPSLIIQTLEGAMEAQRGDWIIRGVQGDLYPCKPDIFAATYEPA